MSTRQRWPVSVMCDVLELSERSYLCLEEAAALDPGARRRDGARRDPAGVGGETTGPSARNGSDSRCDAKAIRSPAASIERLMAEMGIAGQPNGDLLATITPVSPAIPATSP